MVKPRFPGHVEAPSATRRATDKWAHDTMRPEQLDSGSTHTSQPQEGCALLHPLQGVSLLPVDQYRLQPGRSWYVPHGSTSWLWHRGHWSERSFHHSVWM